MKEYPRREWYLACESDKGVLLGERFGEICGGLLAVYRLGRITKSELAFLKRKAVAVHHALASGSVMLTIRAKYLRKIPALSEAGIGSVGCLPIKVKANEFMTVIADQCIDGEYSVWWVHLLFE